MDAYTILYMDAYTILYMDACMPTGIVNIVIIVEVMKLLTLLIGYQVVTEYPEESLMRYSLLILVLA